MLRAATNSVSALFCKHQRRHVGSLFVAIIISLGGRIAPAAGAEPLGWWAAALCAATGSAGAVLGKHQRRHARGLPAPAGTGLVPIRRPCVRAEVCRFIVEVIFQVDHNRLLPPRGAHDPTPRAQPHQAPLHGHSLADGATATGTEVPLESGAKQDAARNTAAPVP